MGFTLSRFYRAEDDLLRLHHELKRTPCPHCKGTGALVLHGWLRGYAEQDECQKVRRGRRVFCNNRKVRRNGCGRTFGVWAADKLRRIRLGAHLLWAFLQLVLQLGNKAQALRSLDSSLSVSSAYRLWKRFASRQSHVRAALLRCCVPPALPRARRPEEQTLAHLKAAFPSAPCPIAAFQHRLQTHFL